MKIVGKYLPQFVFVHEHVVPATARFYLRQRDKLSATVVIFRLVVYLFIMFSSVILSEDGPIRQLAVI